MTRLERLLFWLFVLALSSAVLAMWVEPRLWWRTELVAGKAVGSMSGVPWPDVLAGVLPHKLRDHFDLEAVRIREQARGQGPCGVLWRTRVGDLWGRADDRDALEVAMVYRVYDEIFLRGDAALRPGDVVIDAGGHLGTFTALALGQGAQRVIVFEPDPVNATCLRQTFAPEIGGGSVVILEEAVWNEPGVLRFQESRDSLISRVSDPASPESGEPEITVRATTIDAAVARLGIARVDLIKLNVEGAEANGVRGARETIRRFRPRIVVNLEHRPEDAEVIPGLVRGLVPDYRIAWRGRQEAFFYRPR